VRRETGKEYVVKVHCDEGVAIHVAPDLCAGVREGVGEASVRERIPLVAKYRRADTLPFIIPQSNFDHGPKFSLPKRFSIFAAERNAPSQMSC
jgi:hypothetical protein